MNKFIYNDMEFSVIQNGSAWDINRKLPNGDFAFVGVGLYKELGEAEAAIRAQTLVKSIFPVGVKLIGPNVSHPTMVGDLKIIGPDVRHPNFIYWDKDSASFAK